MGVTHTGCLNKWRSLSLSVILASEKIVIHLRLHSFLLRLRFIYGSLPLDSFFLCLIHTSRKDSSTVCLLSLGINISLLFSYVTLFSFYCFSSSSSSGCCCLFFFLLFISVLTRTFLASSDIILSSFLSLLVVRKSLESFQKERQQERRNKSLLKMPLPCQVSCCC